MPCVLEDGGVGWWGFYLESSSEQVRTKRANRGVALWELCIPEFGSTADSSKCRGCVAYLSTYCLSCLTCGRNGFPCVPWWFCRGTGGSRCGGTGSHCLSRVMGLMGLGISVRQGLVVAYGKTFGCIWLILGCVMIVVIRSPWRRWRHFLNVPLGVCPVPSVPIICVWDTWTSWV